MRYLSNSFLFILIEYIPLKQGLRLSYDTSLIIMIMLIEYIPLKQGLRQSIGIFTRIQITAHRVYSIKTRIKNRKSNSLGGWVQVNLIKRGVKYARYSF